MASGTIKLDTLTVASSDDITYNGSTVGTAYLYTNGMKRIRLNISTIPTSETDISTDVKYAPSNTMYFVGMHRNYGMRCMRLWTNAGLCKIRCYASDDTGAYLDMLYV